MPRETVPVRIRGVDYPSVKAAAAALNVTPPAVCGALARGAVDRVGLSKKYTGKRTTINGVEYVSRKAAAAALGLSTDTLRRKLEYRELGP